MEIKDLKVGKKYYIIFSDKRVAVARCLCILKFGMICHYSGNKYAVGFKYILGPYKSWYRRFFEKIKSCL